MSASPPFLRQLVSPFARRPPTVIREQPPIAAPRQGKSSFDTRRGLEQPVGLARDLLKDPRQFAKAKELWLGPLLDDPRVLDSIQADPVPIPSTSDREGYYADRHLAYWLSGRSDIDAIHSSPVPKSALRSVLDFGGASGRVARHILLANQTSDLTIAELNVNHVEWVETYFPSTVRPVKISVYPHLPLEDRSITLCTAFSVFTHIDAYQSGWIAELHRVISNDGWAFVTIHSEDTWSLLPDIYVYQTLKDNDEFKRLFRPGGPMPSDFLVFDYNPDSIEYNCNVFAHSDYIRQRWGKWFDVVSIIPGAHAYQTAVILHK
jgi:hypothetical protein